MSFFKNIKDTFKTVPDDFSDGFKTLNVEPEKPKVTHEPQMKAKGKVNWEAGADILHRNELMWKDLYQYTEVTAHKAQEVDVSIGRLHAYCNGQTEMLLQLHNEAARLPVLLTQLQDITDSLADVEDSCGKVEALLIQLENLCEQQEYERNVLSHHKQLAVYKMKKEHELQTYRVQLARQHADQLEVRNKKRQDLLQEKQKAYDEQFTQDVDYFKKHGRPGRLPSTPESVKKLELADVEIEEDPTALDAFLQADTQLSETKDSPDSEPSEVTSDTDAGNTQTIPDITSPDSENPSGVSSPVPSATGVSMDGAKSEDTVTDTHDAKSETISEQTLQQSSNSPEETDSQEQS